MGSNLVLSILQIRLAQQVGALHSLDPVHAAKLLARLLKPLPACHHIWFIVLWQNDHSTSDYFYSLMRSSPILGQELISGRSLPLIFCVYFDTTTFNNFTSWHKIILCFLCFNGGNLILNLNFKVCYYVNIYWVIIHYIGSLSPRSICNLFLLYIW